MNIIRRFIRWLYGPEPTPGLKEFRNARPSSGKCRIPPDWYTSVLNDWYIRSDLAGRLVERAPSGNVLIEGVEIVSDPTVTCFTSR